jgi:DNA-binding response OmpR family regulator
LDQQGRILVVDDEPDTVDLIRLTLETAGYEVEQALDGMTALGLIESGDFDVILLDIMMPDISGFDVLHKLHATGTTFPPIVFLTARHDPSDRETGEDLGASDFLTKPAKRGELLDAITRAIGGG